MAQLVAEKDSGLRQAMRTMGLMESSYWISWITFDLVFNTLLTLVIIASGEPGGRGFGLAAGLGAGRPMQPQRGQRQPLPRACASQPSPRTAAWRPSHNAPLTPPPHPQQA
jgi:hypothetical protein